MSNPGLITRIKRAFTKPSAPSYSALTGYKGASRTRDALAGWRIVSGAKDDLAARDLPTLRERSADLIRNNPIAASAVNTKSTGIVGTGLKLHASIDREFLGLDDDRADAWEAQAERLFQMWARSKDCHVKRTANFYTQQDLILRAVLCDGDHFVQLTTAEGSELPFRLALQHISAARVCNPDNKPDSATLVQGIEKTASGAPVTIHVLNQDPRSTTRSVKRTWTPLPVFDADTNRRRTLHLYRALADDQTRGIPDLAPVIEPLKQLDRYTDTEIDAAVKNAIWALVVQSSNGDGINALFGELSLEDRAAYYEKNPVSAIEDGVRVAGLYPGDSLASFNPSRPNDSFDPFVSAVLNQVGAALELPREVLTKVFASSYSAARASLLQAVQFFDGRRAWLSGEICQPVYGAFIDEQVAVGRLAAPGYFADTLVRAAYLGSEWIGDAPGQIDETKAVDAAERRIAARLSNRKRETAALTGQDWEKNERQLQKEERLIGMRATSAQDRPAQPSAQELDKQDQEEAASARA